MSPAKWLDVAKELGDVRDTLIRLANTWEDVALELAITTMAESVNLLVIDAFKNGIRTKD